MPGIASREKNPRLFPGPLWAGVLIPAALFLAPLVLSASEAQKIAHAILASPNLRPGLCVRIGCGDGKLAAELGKNGRYLVQGLTKDRAKLAAARRYLQAQGRYGPLSVEYSALARLPYADNLVNLLVAEDFPGLLAGGLPLKEIMRVLCPRGTAFLRMRADSGEAAFSKKNLAARLRAAGVKDFEFGEIFPGSGPWVEFRKPWPEGMDEWTHARHGADGNPVSHDAFVRPAARLRWLYGPIWRGGRGTHLSANGRNFYEEDGWLRARDAFNGLPLWKRRLTNNTGRSLKIASGRRVYIVNREGFLVALDAATGKLAFTYKEIQSPSAIVLFEKKLLYSGRGGTGSVDAKSGKLNWKNEAESSASELVAGEGRVFLHRKGQLVGLDLAAGKELWRSPGAPVLGNLLFYRYGVLVCRFYHKGLRVFVYSARDGRLLWKTGPLPNKGFGAYGARGLIWSVPRYRDIQGYDPATGTVKRTWPVKGGHFSYQCSQGTAATSRYLVGGRPLAYLDMKNGKIAWKRVARNGCGGNPGLLLAHGRTYAFPKACRCFSMLRGYSSFAGTAAPAEARPDAKQSARLENGPAFGKVASRSPAAPAAMAPPALSSEWPAFRHDPSRSAATVAPVALPLKKLWAVRVEEQGLPDWLKEDWANNPARGGRLGAPVAAGGLVVAALPDSHRVRAFNAQTGKAAWTYTAAGPVAAPPALSGGFCLFGGQDCWVYALRLADGQPAWRFHAAPGGERMLAFGQLESHAPVAGGVLAENGRAYFAAGRSSELQGGLTGYAVEIRTGKLLWTSSPPFIPRRGKVSGSAYLADLPVSNGKALRLAHPNWTLDAKTGKPLPLPRAGVLLASSRDTLLDCTWPSRGPISRGALYQKYARTSAPLLVFQGDRIFGFQAGRKRRGKKARPGEIFASDKNGKKRWSVPLPDATPVVALILAGEVLFAAGPRKGKGEASKREAGVLRAFSARDGKKLAEVPLDGAPTVEGLAAAYGKLYLSTRDGRLLCFGKAERKMKGAPR